MILGVQLRCTPLPTPHARNGRAEFDPEDFRVSTCLWIAALFQVTQTQLPALPPQLHENQPLRVDHGAHGGLPTVGSAAGDFTPDGLVAVFSRTAVSGGAFVPALVAATVDPDRIVPDAAGNLDRFYDPVVDNRIFGTYLTWGQNYAFTHITQQHVIEIRPTSDPAVNPGPNPPISGSGNLPSTNGGNPLTMVLKQLPSNGPTFGENPYPSNSTGVYTLNGGYRCYELRLIECDYPWTWNTSTNKWEDEFYTNIVRLGVRDLRIIVDNTAATPRIHSTQIGSFTPLTIGSTGTSVRGHEPSIAADGRLLVFHSDGGNNLTQVSGNQWGKTTYSWNPNPGAAAGWSHPRSIVDFHYVEGDVGGPHYAPTAVGVIQGTTKFLKDLYGLARFPIRDPNGTKYAYGAKVEGPYPWLDRDGGFFVAQHTLTVDANPTGQVPQAVATRAGMFVCGDITQGYLKHIDHVGLNATRAGGAMEWPIVPVYPIPHPTQYRNSNRLVMTSTGLKPGLWEPFQGLSVPVPSVESSLRIPVLPIFSLQNDMYGEVRFEECDGEYVLYLACNESFRRIASQGIDVFEVDPTVTPDTSGQLGRGEASLNPGAAFPQEVYGGNAAVRSLTGTPSLPGHECVGFKGQALMFASGGSVTATMQGALSDQVSVQAFAKRITSASNGVALNLVEQPGRFRLRITNTGAFEATVQVASLGAPVTLVATSLATTTASNDPFDITANWRHAAFTFDGATSSGGSELRLYVDGHVAAITSMPTPSVLATGTGSLSTVIVGPRISGGSTFPKDAVIVIDEVAISRIVRTERELRRDAYVAQDPSTFRKWVSAAGPLPVGLDPLEARWPTAVTYSTAKHKLGRDLFGSTILSGAGTSGPNWGQVSCATCHEAAFAFSEPQKLASHFGGGSLDFNTPTVLNTAFGTHKFFDGRSSDVLAQALVPIENPAEMNLPLAQAVARLANPANISPDGQSWNARFAAAFGAGPSSSSLAEALAVFQLTLNSGDSRFDRDAAFRKGLPGGLDALSPAEKRGRALFMGRARCVGCHRGSAISDDDFHNIGTVAASSAITGRGGVTGHVAELGALKVPTLRNLPKSGPYFHDGSATALRALIQHYDRGGILASGGSIVGARDRALFPLFLTTGEMADLEAFLLAMQGTQPQ